MNKICSKCKKEKEQEEFYLLEKFSEKRMGQCKQCRKDNVSSWRKKNPQKYLLRIQAWRKENVERYRAINKKHADKWTLDNPMYKNTHNKQRRASDPLFKLKCNIRVLIGNAFKRKIGWKKNTKTQMILGCNFTTLYDHLIQTFKNRYGRMPTNLDNIHIDHIIPCSLAKNEEELLKLNNYNNLQWLLAIDNLKKSNKVG